MIWLRETFAIQSIFFLLYLLVKTTKAGSKMPEILKI